MASPNRRQFLRSAAGAGVLGWAPAWLRAETKAGKPARVLIEPSRTSADLDRRLFGSFLEHIGRAIYEGIYQPDSPLANAQGFRKDVLDELRPLHVPIVRYPGGNFVSGYNWLDGVGPKEKRPRVLDRAWNSLETNQFGTDEFIAWCREAGTEPMLAVNLGTGTAESAANLVEYCNVPKGTRWSDLRRQNGSATPHGVRRWCLGNEMDGPWQIGHLSAEDYGRKAADTARQMRMVDKSLQLVACGSSSPTMPSYLEWDRVVLERCYNEVDAISLHRYFSKTNEAPAGSETFLALNLAMEKQIREVAGVCDFVRARLRSPKQLWLCFDEWNVWYRTFQPMSIDGKRTQAPHLVEELYSLEDALLVGGILNTLLRNAGRVRIACLAQLVNVIAPLMTNDQQVVRQTIYYPYAWALRFARGKVLDLTVESDAYQVPRFGSVPYDSVPYLDAAATWDPATGETSLFLLNRDLEKDREVALIWRENPPARVTGCHVLTGKDLADSNSFSEPNRVIPHELEAEKVGDRVLMKLPARSFTVVRTAAGEPTKKE